jgi:dihydrofolate reductase
MIINLEVYFMKAIVCVDNSWGIGKNGDLLVYNKTDLQYFKEKTLGKTVVMGSKTLESFKNSKPLPNRTNIVFSKQDLNRDDIVQFKSIEEFLKSEYFNDDTFVIGGGQIYKLLLPYVNYIYVTKMEKSYDADTFFPNLDELNEFKVERESEMLEFNDIKFKFMEYKRI